MDDDGNKKLNYDEFKKGLHDYGCAITDDEAKELCQAVDTNGDGSVDFDEFLSMIRPPMSQGRINLVEKAFQVLDKTGDGVITIADLKGVYNARKHPKYLNGELTEAEVFQEFLKSFEMGEADGKVTKEEFINYYSGVSDSIDQDAYFDLMMRNAWKF